MQRDDALQALRDQLAALQREGEIMQIEFDPMWEIVKDDPEVRKLLK